MIKARITQLESLKYEMSINTKYKGTSPEVIQSWVDEMGMIIEELKKENKIAAMLRGREDEG